MITNFLHILLKIIGGVWFGFFIFFALVGIVIEGTDQLPLIATFVILSLLGLLPFIPLRKRKEETLSNKPSGKTTKEHKGKKEIASTTDNKEVPDKDIEFLQQVDYENAIEKDKHRKEMLGITEEDEELASDFHFDDDHFSALEKLDADFNQKYDHGDWEDAIKALDALRAYCLKYGRGGFVHYMQSYEWLHNSKNPCFSYREIIADNIQIGWKPSPKKTEEEILKEEQRYQEILFKIPSILSESKGGIIQKDLYKQFSDEKDIAVRAVQELHKQGIIQKEKMGNSFLLKPVER